MAERALPPPPADERLADRALGGLVAWALVRLESGRDWDELEARVSRIERAAVEAGNRVTAGAAVALLGSLALYRGAPVTAARRLREAGAHLEANDPRGLAVIAAAELAQAEAMVGRVESAQRAREAARLRLGVRPAAWHERTKLARADAWIAAATGELARAAELCRNAAEAASDWPVFQAQLLREALSAGAGPRDVAGPLKAAASRCDSRLAAAYAAHATALAECDGDALLSAARELSAIGAKLAAAEAAAQAGAVQEAAGRLAAASRSAGLSARLQQECEGARTPALGATHPAAAQLTRREREIAEQAARGRSNQEIAAALTISVRTVESHLYHAMTKLGVASRDELGAAVGPVAARTGGR
jgi:DNA-binding NarL/FixJ family response regulator